MSLEERHGGGLPHKIASDEDEDEDEDVVVDEDEDEDAKGPLNTKEATLAPEGSKRENTISKWRKDMFGDCALIEIIHLHECLRGALKALERDVNVLSQSVSNKKKTDELSQLERRVAGRFKVIWSVFRAHSSAEDEFIWPALRIKTKGAIKGSPKYSASANYSGTNQTHAAGAAEVQQQQQQQPNQDSLQIQPSPALPSTENDTIEQEEYEEDHADEERMFSMMDELLVKLRNALVQQNHGRQESISSLVSCTDSTTSADSVDDTMQELNVLTKKLCHHLVQHLEKEEIQCMPLVLKHLSKTEIYDLVGKIMGKRSSDTIAQIMTMAVQNLNDEDRAEMVKYMKQAMAGTFFDRWLSMSGWMEDTAPKNDSVEVSSNSEKKRPSTDVMLLSQNSQEQQAKHARTGESGGIVQKYPTEAALLSSLGGLHSVTGCSSTNGITTQAELEKNIRAIATNPNLSAVQKNLTIQGLRDSVYKSNQRIKENISKQLAGGGVAQGSTSGLAHNPFQCHPTGPSTNSGMVAASTMFTPIRRVTPPSAYFKKGDDGKITKIEASDEIPLFSPSELAPTHHDGARGSVLGCPHYARACKLRHPSSGRLYTCRLCCEQVRELPSKDQDVPLDRYAVKEVMCMKCNALQPAEDRCINPSCESEGKPFAKYFCRICHLYDDRSRPIFHCPYCNTCRMGQGIGIDFFHCMRCNACVSMAEKEHRCIPQKLQGSCPICHESLFQSTEPLRGVQCGHVMHLSCFVQYRRGQRYTCPLCMRSMEDMSDYFALLDAAVRMQPMPVAFLSTVSNIYCQDCSKTGQCQYHFVGQKCPHCGSYNTRELGRIDMAGSMT